MNIPWKRAVLPAGLVVAVLGGSVAYTAATAGSADRTVETRLWGQLPASSAQQKPGSAPVRTGPLGELLLPVPNGFVKGPDPGRDAAGTELTEAQATARLLADGAGLPGKERREYERRVKAIGIKGMAGRSFMSVNDGAVIEVELTRLTNPALTRATYDFLAAFQESGRLTRKPMGEARGNAACFTSEGPPEGNAPAEGLGRVECLAHHGGHLVVVSAYGTAGIAENTAVAEVLQHQIELIASPGKSV
ncbi:hypothetical protein [Streptomyces sp. NPDC058953]|uniref:hypothetical protein n=1 Tax=unclassified Streptomyces TaxID=2593676 RepID=UPI0036B6D575